MSLSRFERTLVESGAREAPGAARRSAARAAVMKAAGVGGAVAAVTLAANATANAASGASGVAAAPAVVGVAKITLLVKVALLAAVASGVIGVAVVASSRGDRGERGAVPTAQVATTGAVATVHDVATLPVGQLPEAVVPETTATLAPARVVAPAPAARAQADEIDPVAAEARLLEGARLCLAAGDDTCARSRLAEHSAKFPRGVLGDEARLLQHRAERAGDDR